MLVTSLRIWHWVQDWFGHLVKHSQHLLLLIKLLLQLLVMRISLRLALIQVFTKLTLVVPVLSTQLLVGLHCVLRYLLELPKLFVDVLLDLGSLG